MITKIDFANKTHITYIIISIIILFGIIYIWQNFKSNKHIDGFTQYNVNSDDAVTLFALDNVLIGNENLTLTQKLESLYYKITDGKTMDTRLTTALTAMSTDIAEYKKTVTGLIATNKTELINSIANNKVDLDTKINTNTTDISKNTPHLTIIAYYGISAPTGWQICDGEKLKAEDNTTFVYYKIGAGTGTSTKLNTPDLRGRSILGLNTNGALTKTKIGDKGGEEKHTLTVNEMPSHNHSSLVGSMGSDTHGHHINDTRIASSIGWQRVPYASYTESNGSNLAHNNMHPVYVLNYIIKQPKLGGKSNSISLQEAPSTSTISFLK